MTNKMNAKVFLKVVRWSLRTEIQTSLTGTRYSKYFPPSRVNFLRTMELSLHSILF